MSQFERVGEPWVDLNFGPFEVKLDLDFGVYSNDLIGGFLILAGVFGFFRYAGQHHKYNHADGKAALSLLSVAVGGVISSLG